MGGPADQRVGTDDVACDGQRQVVLTKMQHVGAGGQRDVGAVVDRHQRAVAPRRVREHGQQFQFLARLQRPELLLAGRALVPQLDDVDPAGQRRVGELGEVAALAPGVGAQIQRCGGQAFQGLVHTATVATTPRSCGSRTTLWPRPDPPCMAVCRAASPALAGSAGAHGAGPTLVLWRADTGVPGPGTESGHVLPLPSHLIRVMPAKGGVMSKGSLAVVGGGVIGLSVARRAALDGWSVRVHRSDDPGASWVAGGMLAPHSEGWPGEERLLRLGLASLALWTSGAALSGRPARRAW